jgi:ribose/xylose/arabinose/galactoside ABC-type transport system permease subunit
LAGCLLPGWCGGDDVFFDNTFAQMLAVQLLPAMGFMLVLRLRTIDLSVWMSFALGGAVAAWLILGGAWPMWAILSASLAGLGVGLFNWLMVGVIRIIRPIRRACPINLAVPIATLATAIIIFYWLAGTTGGKTITLPAGTWGNWHVTQSLAPAGKGTGVDGGVVRSNADKPSLTYIAPLSVTRMLFVAGFYSLVMLAMLLLGRHGITFSNNPENLASLANSPSLSNTSPAKKGWQLATALCVSGMLAGAGGACQLIDTFRAAPPHAFIGDLRIPAAAILAGAIFLAGPGRTLLCGLLLPACLLLATVWRYQAWYLNLHGFDIQVLALIAMLAVAYFTAWTAQKAQHGKRILAVFALVLAILAVLLTALSGQFPQHQIRDAINITAGVMWVIAGLASVVIYRGLACKTPVA